MIKRYYCKVCNVDIKQANCFPVVDDEDIICSDCCKIAIFYHLGYMTEEQFKLLPKYTREYCLKYHLRKLEEENKDLLNGKTVEKWLEDSKNNKKLTYKMENNVNI